MESRAAVLLLMVLFAGIISSMALYKGSTSKMISGVERIDVSESYVIKDVDSGNYSIYFRIKNTGDYYAGIKMVYINNVSYCDESFKDKVSFLKPDGSWITSGSLNISIGDDPRWLLLRVQPASGSHTQEPFIQGASLAVKFSPCSGGRDYLTTVLLAE